MGFGQKYRLWVRDFSQFRYQHKFGGNLIIFLLNMGLWNLASHLVAEAYFSNFYIQVGMSLLFTAAFYVHKDLGESKA